MWSEDGSIYTYQAIWHGSIRSIGLGYNGYLQLPPRLLALPTPYFSLRYLALYFALTTAIIGALLAWNVYHLSKGWVTSPGMRVVLASFVVLMPALGLESTATATNSIWVFLAVLPWALISLEESRRDTALRAVLAFLGATASALSLLFIPLGLGWLAYRRTRSALVVVGVMIAGDVIQGVVALTTHTAANSLSKAVNNPSHLRDAIGARVFGVFLFGTRWEAELWRANWRVVIVIAPLVVLAALALLLPGAERAVQAMAVTFTVLAVLLFAVPAWGRGTFGIGMVEGGRDALVSSRFSVVPVMLLASAFAILLTPAAASRRLSTRIGQPIFAVQVAVLLIVCFSLTTYRGTDPSWTSRVDRVLAQ